MLKLPLVTFVVTSFNYANFIEQTLESIKNQSYKNFEIVVVDDCSSDNSVEVIERFIRFNQDLRITLIKHDKNLGQFASMLDGLRIANGKFVSFVDSDDILLEKYAETHVRVHLSTSVAFTCSRIVEIDEDNEIHTTYSVSSPQTGLADEAKTLEDLLKVDSEKVEYEHLGKKRFGGWYWSPDSSAMFRKSSIETVLNYKNPDKWRVCPDKFLFNFANLVGGSIVIFAPLVAYRRHSNNAGGSDYVCGNTRYNSDKTTMLNIENNFKIRPETLSFLIKNRSDFIKKFGTRGFLKMLLKIVC